LVKIRLKRMGTTKRPFYRLVVADSRSPRDGRFIEALGFYDPLPQPASVRIDAERVQEWLRRGARPSDSARDLLVAQGILAANPKRGMAPTEAVITPETAVKPEKAARPGAAAEPAVEPEKAAVAEAAVAEPDAAAAASESDDEVTAPETPPGSEEG